MRCVEQWLAAHGARLESRYAEPTRFRASVSVARALAAQCAHLVYSIEEHVEPRVCDSICAK